MASILSRIAVGLALVIAAIVALLLLTTLYEAVVPWERTPWGGAVAQGRIVAHEPYPRDRSYSYPVVVFTTAADEHRFVDGSPWRAADYPVGAQVTVIYDPADPGRARVGSFSDLAFNAAALTVVALIAVAGLVRALRPARGRAV